MNDEFRPIPSASITRLRSHISALNTAQTTDDQIRALFLAHCELKDIEHSLPAREDVVTEKPEATQEEV